MSCSGSDAGYRERTSVPVLDGGCSPVLKRARRFSTKCLYAHVVQANCGSSRLDGMTERKCVFHGGSRNRFLAIGLVAAGAMRSILPHVNQGQG